MYTDAFLRRGRPSSCLAVPANPAKRLRARQASSLIQASGWKQELEEFLDANDRADPDLVDFWVGDLTEEMTQPDASSDPQPKQATSKKEGSSSSNDDHEVWEEMRLEWINDKRQEQQPSNNTMSSSRNGGEQQERQEQQQKQQ